jgi:purine-nucleoside phosphorylase
VNLMGENALAGWRFPDGSPAFVDLSGTYDDTLADTAVEHSAALGIPATEGVYAAFRGPSFETAAEIHMLRTVGAAVVGMSMVPETVAAHAQGMHVLGLAWVANAAGVPVHHQEVLEAGRRASEDAGRLIAAILARPT